LNAAQEAARDGQQCAAVRAHQALISTGVAAAQALDQVSLVARLVARGNLHGPA